MNEHLLTLDKQNTEAFLFLATVFSFCAPKKKSTQFHFTHNMQWKESRAPREKKEEMQIKQHEAAWQASPVAASEQVLSLLPLFLASVFFILHVLGLLASNKLL